MADQSASTDVFRRAFDGAGAGMVLVRAGTRHPGEVFYANATAGRMTGRSSDELLGESFGALALEADREGLTRAWQQVSTRHEAVSLEQRILHKDGTVRWIELDLFPIDSAHEEGPVIGAQFRDVTERKRASRALEARGAIAEVLGQATSVRGAISALMAALAESLDFDLAALWSPTQRGGELRCTGLRVSGDVELRSFAEITRASSFAPGSGLPGRAWDSGQLEASADLAAEPGCPRASAAEADGLHAAVAFPVLVGPRPYGVLELVSRETAGVDHDLRQLVRELSEEIPALLARKRAQEHRPTSSELLLVEDDAFVARFVQEMLGASDLGLELDHVASLADARERLVAAPPTCVLLDLTLPDAEGLEALLEIRRVAPDLPVVVLTGVEDEELAVRAVQEGAQDYLMKRTIDVDGLVRSLHYAIERSGVQQQQLDQRLEDEVTGLPTRTLLGDRIRVALGRSDRESVGVLLLNLDRFRTVNDTLGHDCGDQVLVKAANRLLTALPAGTSVASFGGDEFAVLVEAASAKALLALAEELRGVLEEPYEVAGEEFRLTATVGTAVAEKDGAEALLRRADAALSRGKSRGGGRVEAFDEGVREGLRERFRLMRELREGIERGELRLGYQPIVSLQTGATVAFEALVRWEHPERGLVGPPEFISLAEENGLSGAVGEWVLEEACRQLASWRDEFAAWANGAMNVNVSATELTDPELVPRVERALARSGLTDGLRLEVTETALIGDLDLSGEILERLKALGVEIALDDFGTGYSSLTYLERFPIDVVKLDRSFVVGLRSHRRPAIVAAVATMARGLGMPVVAEGVEDEEEAAELRELGYDQAQGFLYAPALPADEAAATLRGQTGRKAS